MNPKIIFICVGNSCRSQMAEGFAKTLGKGTVEVFSAGTNPAGYVNPIAIEVMLEKDIDISGQVSKGIYDIREEKFDIAVTMGCSNRCPGNLANRVIDWDIPDPVGSHRETFVSIRNLIEKKVERLIQETGGM